MATDLQTPTDQSATSLVGGIIDDMQDLVKQQIQLTKKEIKEGVANASEAVQLFAIGGAVLAIGLIIVGLTLVHLLHWVSAPAGTDPARIPLWACHAVVGIPLTVLGCALAWMGRQKISAIDPLNNPATEALKENVKWATSTK